MSKTEISSISDAIRDELKIFEKHFRKAVTSEIILLDVIVKYILRQKGKRIRPLLVLLSARLAGEIGERSYRGAALVELLHTATLIHDDVVDNSEERRGFPSINAVWKNKIAVLVGDFFLSKGLMLSVSAKDFDFLEIVTNTVKRMSEGELLQISKTKKYDIDEATYFRIISDKTASLLSTCCEIGALSSTQDEEKIKAMRDFGENLGIAFQIKDDLLDYTGKSHIIGKPAGADIKEKKITLPLIYALKNAPEKHRKEIIKNIKKIKKTSNINDILKFAEQYKGIEMAENKAMEYIEKAKKSIAVFSDEKTKEPLLALLEFIMERKK